MLSDSEALTILDEIDWWVPSIRGAKALRSLREALIWCAAQEGDITLFRPPGGEAACAWIFPDQVRSLCRLMAQHDAHTGAYSGSTRLSA